MGVAYGLDNILADPGRAMLYHLDTIYPIKFAKFETMEVGVPAKTEVFLDACYREWPYLPFDILGGHEHFEKEQMQKKEIMDAMKNYIE